MTNQRKRSMRTWEYEPNNEETDDFFYSYLYPGHSYDIILDMLSK